MCGIHFVLNKNNSYNVKLNDFVKEGFIAGSLRGMDSSGIFQIDRKDGPFLYKQAIPGSVFVEQKITERFIRDVSTSLISVCHVRHATQGDAKKNVNAHPFLIERADKTRVIGVHNGTLNGWRYGKHSNSKFDVDSEWALSRIAEDGVDAFEYIEGAFAFVWWDERNPFELKVVRNEARPLHFAVDENDTTLLAASEAGMLAWLIERNQIKTKEAIFQFEPNKIYTFDLSGNKITWKKGFIPEYKKPVSTSYVHPNYSHTHSSVAGKDVDIEKMADHAVQEIKQALSLNRQELNKSPQVYLRSEKRKSKKELRRERAMALQANRKSQEISDDDLLAADKCRSSWYSNSTATSTERQAAEELGVAGDLQWFIGVHYDEETSELLGQFEDYLSGEGKVTYMATMRNVSKAIAELWSAGGWVAVIGAKHPSLVIANEYIVAPLNSAGNAAMEKCRSASAAH